MSCTDPFDKPILCILSAILGLATPAHSEVTASQLSVSAIPAPEAPATKKLQERSAKLLSDLTDRQKSRYLFQNPQRPEHGVQKSFVNVGLGNLTFIQRDLVLLDRIPLVAGRVYDSRINDNRDFGPGWKLTVDERLIPIDSSNYEYVDANNSRHVLNFLGDGEVETDGTLQLRSGHARGDSITIADAKFKRTFEKEGEEFILVRIEDRNGSWIAIGHDRGLVRRLETSGGRTFDLIRDGAMRITGIAGSNGAEVSYSYNKMGRLISSSLLSGAKLRYRYNPQNLLTDIVDPRGTSVLFAQYDPSSQQVTKIQTGFSPVYFQYRNGKTEVTEVPGTQVTFRQDFAGRTVSVTSPLGFETSLGFESSQSGPTDFGANGTTFASANYRIDGSLSDVTVASSLGDRQLWFDYAPDRFLSSIRSSGGETKGFSYDSAGRLTNYENSTGSGYEIAWHESGHPVAIKTAEATVDIATDQFGRVTGWSTGTGVPIRIQYDDFDRVTQLDIADRQSATYVYGRGKQRTEATYDESYTVRTGYDEAANISEIEFYENGDFLGADHFTLGPRNELREIVSSAGTVTSFAYDSYGRAVRVEAAGKSLEVEYGAENEPPNARIGNQSMGVLAGVVPQSHAADHRASSYFLDQAAGSGVFGSISEIAYLRPDYAPYKLVAYDATSDRFLLRNETDWIPEQSVLEGYTSSQLPLKAELSDASIGSFDSLTNTLFIPAEFYYQDCPPCNAVIVSHNLKINSSSSAVVPLGTYAAFSSSVVVVGCGPGTGPPYSLQHKLFYGDGASSVGYTPGSWGNGHQYAQSGTYNASATAECPCGVFGISVATAKACVQSPFSPPVNAVAPAVTYPTLVNNGNSFGQTNASYSVNPLTCRAICDGKYRLEGDIIPTMTVRASSGLPVRGVCSASSRSSTNRNHTRTHELVHANALVAVFNSYKAQFGQEYTSQSSCMSGLNDLVDDLKAAFDSEIIDQHNHVDHAGERRHMVYCPGPGPTKEGLCGLVANFGCPNPPGNFYPGP